MAHPELRNPFDREDLAPGDGATVLTADRTILVERVLQEPGLWVTPEDLTRIDGFVLKPEGACLGELCVPLPPGADLLRTADGQEWFDLAAFADHMGQTCVVEEETNTWSLGDLPATRTATLTDAQAPDVELTDRQGNVVRLEDFRGRKALVITWSSW
jgi:hypothetical protein